MSIEFEASTNSYAQIKQSMAPQNAPDREIEYKAPETASESQPTSSKASNASSPATSSDSLSSSSSQYMGEPMITEDPYSIPMDLSSDDSNYEMNLESSQEINRASLSSNALKELKNSLDKDGVLGQSLTNGYASEDGGVMIQQNKSTPVLNPSANTNNRDDQIDNFGCHLCSFQATNKEDYKHHMQFHFSFKCSICDYTSRTKGRLRRHISDFHSETPPGSWARRNDTSGEKEKGKEKSKTLKCKQCAFTCTNKQEYYGHLQANHMDEERVLKCPHCYFVTTYKHHFEYHLRNHVGLKPYRCGKCNYSCVNKSMLNSHEKSHSQIYPFRCNDCKYATKYCHSLKIHLRKYLHKPGQTLNADGTPNNNPVIDIYGRRRGPKAKNKKVSPDKSIPASKALTCTQSAAIAESNGVLPDQQMQYPLPYFTANSFPPMLMNSPPIGIQFPSYTAYPGRPFKCHYCNSVIDSLDLYQQHVVSHATRENPDLIRTFNININPDIFHMQAEHLTFNNFPQNSIHYSNNASQVEHKNDTPFTTANNCSVTEEHSHHSSSPLLSNGNMSDDMVSKTNKIKHSPSTQCTASTSNDLSPIVTENRLLPILAKAFKTNDISDDYGNISTINKLKNNITPIIRPESIEISPKSSMMRSGSELVEISDNSLDNLADSHSPLDLSKTKSSSFCESQLLENRSTAVSSCNNRMAMSLGHGSTPSRNRRKGKAFKLDQFVQYDESPTKANFPGVGLIGGSEKPKKSLIKKKDPNCFMYSFPASTATATVPRIDEINQRYANANGLLNFNASMIPSSKEFATNGSRNSSPLQSESASETSLVSSSYSNTSPVVPKLEPGIIENNTSQSEATNNYTCKFCEMDFKDCAMYTMHMGYHGYGDPFTCNKCGCICGDKVDFFLHLVRIAHL